MAPLSKAPLIKWACVFTKNKWWILFHVYSLSTQIPCGHLHYFHWKWSHWPAIPFCALLCSPSCPALGILLIELCFAMVPATGWMPPFRKDLICTCGFPCSQTTSEAPYCSPTCQPWWFFNCLQFSLSVSCLSLLQFIPVTVGPFPFSILSMLCFYF